MRGILQIRDGVGENFNIVPRVSKHDVAHPAKDASKLICRVVMVSSPSKFASRLCGSADSALASLGCKDSVPLFGANSILLPSISVTNIFSVLLGVFLPVGLLFLFVLHPESLHSDFRGIASVLLIRPYLLLVGLAIFALICLFALPAFFEGFGTLVAWSRHARTRLRVRFEPDASNIRRLHFIKVMEAQ